MVGKLVTLSVKAGTGAVRLAFNLTVEAAKLAGGIAERATGSSGAPSDEAPYKDAPAPAMPAPSDKREAPEPEAPEELEAEPVGEATAEALEPEPAIEPRSADPPEPAHDLPESAVEPRSADPPEPAVDLPESAVEPPEPTPVGETSAVDPETSPPTPLDPAEDVAKTIDDESELVAEFAERGAQDGAGASATVEEPWEGYRDMHAEAVIARIDEAGLAELSILELYERAHRDRQTVLSAADRRHRTLTAPGSL